MPSPPEPPRTDIDFNSGPGHLLSLSSSLLHDQIGGEPDFDGQRPFSVADEDLKRLLSTSLKLPLTDEITPVQIWSRVRDLSGTLAMERKTLDALREEFAKYVYCNR